MSLPRFGYACPDSLQQAFEEVHDGAIPFCGGTELLAAMGMGLLRPERLVSLRRVPDLHGVSDRGDHLRIAATTTHDEVSRSPLVRERLPMLAKVAANIGNWRVRSFGTAGGNLAFAEPRSDLLTALIAYDASVELSDGATTRTVSAADFQLGPYETCRNEGEIVTGMRVPNRDRGASTYRKVVFTERPVVGVGLVLDSSSGSWRLAIGAVGDEGFVHDFASLAEIDASAVAEQIDVVSDMSGSEAYKRSLTATTIVRCVQDVEASGGGHQ